MINLKNNLDIADKIIINYLIKTDEFELYDEMNNVLDRYKIIRLIHHSYFINPISQNIFKVITAFVKEYRKIPNAKEIVQKAELDFYDLEEDTIKLFFSMDMEEFTSDFVFKYLKAFIIRGQLNHRLVNVVTKLKTEDVDVDGIEELFDYVKSQFSSVDLEFTDASRGLNLNDGRSHVQLDIKTKPTGFPYLDRVIGGWEPKTLVVFQGRPKVGKCTSGSTYVKIRNKKTGIIENIKFDELAHRLK